jgi:hypothetical protein
VAFQEALFPGAVEKKRELRSRSLTEQVGTGGIKTGGRVRDTTTKTTCRQQGAKSWDNKGACPFFRPLECSACNLLQEPGTVPACDVNRFTRPTRGTRRFGFTVREAKRGCNRKTMFSSLSHQSGRESLPASARAAGPGGILISLIQPLFVCVAVRRQDRMGLQPRRCVETAIRQRGWMVFGVVWAFLERYPSCFVAQ